ncbi:MAG: TlpA disulfide reductase family protein, partial [Bacteroidota bacterium]
MKLHLFILSLFIICQLSAQDKKVVYLADGKSMTENEYKVFKNDFKEKAEKENKNAELEEIINDSITSDTIYKLCTLSYSYSSVTFDKEFVESYINKKFPFFEFETMESSIIHLKELEGKPTLINLWFVGCAPCMRELPALEDLKSKYGGKVNFVAITFSNK